MTVRPYDHAGRDGIEADLRARRRRHVDLALMLMLEVLCAACGVAAFLALAAGDIGWSATFALLAIVSYLAADGVERS